MTIKGIIDENKLYISLTQTIAMIGIAAAVGWRAHVCMSHVETELKEIKKTQQQQDEKLKELTVAIHNIEKREDRWSGTDMGVWVRLAMLRTGLDLPTAKEVTSQRMDN